MAFFVFIFGSCFILHISVLELSIDFASNSPHRNTSSNFLLSGNYELLTTSSTSLSHILLQRVYCALHVIAMDLGSTFVLRTYSYSFDYARILARAYTLPSLVCG